MLPIIKCHLGELWGFVGGRIDDEIVFVPENGVSQFKLESPSLKSGCFAEISHLLQPVIDNTPQGDGGTFSDDMVFDLGPLIFDDSAPQDDMFLDVEPLVTLDGKDFEPLAILEEGVCEPLKILEEEGVPDPPLILGKEVPEPLVIPAQEEIPVARSTPQESQDIMDLDAEQQASLTEGLSNQNISVQPVKREVEKIIGEEMWNSTMHILVKYKSDPKPVLLPTDSVQIMNPILCNWMQRMSRRKPPRPEKAARTKSNGKVAIDKPAVPGKRGPGRPHMVVGEALQAPKKAGKVTKSTSTGDGVDSASMPTTKRRGRSRKT